MALKILAWCIAVLLLSLAAFIAVAAINIHRMAPFFAGLSAMQRDDAIHAYETGGPDGLRNHLARLQQYIPAHYYLTDAQGKDLASGQNREDLLLPDRRHRPERFITSSRDDRYRFIAVAPPPEQSIWAFLPFYMLVPLAVGLLGWALAVNIASPLRRMAQVVDRFGRGDLSARIEFNRKDEIGGLARAFDVMADRIETLLTAERRLLQDISHELRSPLTRIGFAAALTRTADDREAAVERLKKEISRLSELVNALLQVTRAEGDPSTRNVQSVPLPELLRNIVEDSQIEARARGCEISLVSPESLTLQGDYELLRRALENVVRNAIRYAPQGTKVEVSVETAGAAATIRVRDYGPGVPEDALPKLFHPFFRVDSARDSASGGTGLGLAIAQRAVAVHSGSIRAQNVSPGLQVTISIPVQAQSQ
jgi:two-component system sensor histidine kinase CpxA